jgi:perosamine synthetase
MGTLSTFSFYANKPLTTGEGGMIMTDDPVLANQARSRRDLAFDPGRRFLHRELGFNFRLTNLQAALGVAQIDRMDAIVERRRWIGAEYTRRLRGRSELQLPVEEPWARNVYWMFGMVLDEATGIDGAEFSRRLRERGIETRPFFLGMHEQPVFRSTGLFDDDERHPVAERIARQGVYVPSGLDLTEELIAEVCEAIEAALD